MSLSASQRPSRPFLFLHLLVAFLAITLAACNYPVPQVGALPPQIRATTGPSLPTPTKFTPGTITGRVWWDQCGAGAAGAGVAGAGTSVPGTPVSPPINCALLPSLGYTANGVLDPGEPGIPFVKIHLGQGSCPSTGYAETTTVAGSLDYAFNNLPPGKYCVSIDPSLEPSKQALLPGGWTHPQRGEGTAMQPVTLTAGEKKSNIDFGWDYAYQPIPTLTPTPLVTEPGYRVFLPGITRFSQPDQSGGGLSPAEATPTPAGGETGGGQGEGSPCSYAVKFIADVTIPDDTVLPSGAVFEKTWRIQNNGTCTWGPEGYDLRNLVFAGGDQLDAPAALPLPGTVEPGEQVDLSVPMKAPSRPGTYSSYWMLKLQDGTLIGLGPLADLPLYVRIIVQEPEPSQEAPVVHAPHAPAPPQVDGDTADWNGFAYSAKSPVFGAGSWSGPADQLLEYSLTWDADYLYVGAHVRDDAYVQTQLGSLMFKGDSLEILFDANRSGDLDSHTLNNDDYQLGLTPGLDQAGADAYLWFPKGKQGRPVGVQVAARPDDEGSGYYLEAAIPWAATGASPNPGTQYGFAISSSDNDQRGTAQQQTLISSAPGRDLSDPATWGTLVLDP